ncbi:MAG: hypothetical protein ACI9UD_000094 [Glaciecola sp.]|jgi:hypothetical protein
MITKNFQMRLLDVNDSYVTRQYCHKSLIQGVVFEFEFEFEFNIIAVLIDNPIAIGN